MDKAVEIFSNFRWSFSVRKIFEIFFIMDKYTTHRELSESREFLMASDISFKKFSCINLSLLPIKTHYLFLYGAVAGVSPFLPVIGKDLGLNAKAVGIVYAMVSVCLFLIKPFFGFLSDYFQNVKTIIICLTTATVTLYICIPFIQPIEENTTFRIPTQLLCSEYRNEKFLFTFNEPCISNESSLSQIKCNISFDDILTKNGTRINKKIVEMETKYQCNKSYTYEYPNSDNTTTKTIKSSCYFTIEKDVSDLKFLFENHSSFVYNYFDCGNEFQTCLMSKYDGKFYLTHQFWIFTFLVALGLGFKFTAMSLTDVACYEMLGEKREHFGQQRLWGTASTAFITFFSGYLNDIISNNKGKTEYLSGFYIMIALYIANIMVIIRMYLPKVHRSKTIMSDVINLCKSKEFIVYGAAVFIIGNFASLNANFLFWYLKDLGGSQTLLGSAIAVQCFAEIILFFFSGQIIKHLRYFNCLTCTFISFAVRFGCYAYLQNPWFILPVEVLHGITYAVFYASKTSFASVYATPGTEGTVFGILGALYDGVGYALGSMLGGIGFYHYGGSMTFLIGCSLSTICIPLTILSHFIFTEKERGFKAV